MKKIFIMFLVALCLATTGCSKKEPVTFALRDGTKKRIAAEVDFLKAKDGYYESSLSKDKIYVYEDKYNCYGVLTALVVAVNHGEVLQGFNVKEGQTLSFGIYLGENPEINGEPAYYYMNDRSVDFKSDKRYDHWYSRVKYSIMENDVEVESGQVFGMFLDNNILLYQISEADISVEFDQIIENMVITEFDQ